MLLGARAVLAESFERIHRSDLIGMGVLPLQFAPGASIDSLGLTGEESFDVLGLDTVVAGAGAALRVLADRRELPVLARLDTPSEREHYRHGGSSPSCCATWPSGRGGSADALRGEASRRHDQLRNSTVTEDRRKGGGPCRNE
jgi:hypothetical protein